MTASAQVTVRWRADGQMRSGSIADLDEARRSELVWVDVEGIDESALKDLAHRFDLHPLAVEDMLHFPQRPKIDEYASNWFIVWVAANRNDRSVIALSEIDMVIAPGLIITVHDEHLRAVDQAAASGPEVLARGEAGLFHDIVDRLVDSLMPLVDDIADRLEDIEDTMLGTPRQDDLENLYRLRRELVKLHRIISPERDVLRALARVRDLIDDEEYRYLQDVGDHLARLEDSIETAREVAAAIMDIYLSSVSNRMNEIMKQLTVVATIFMPLTFISGIYGMNVIKGMWPPVIAFWSFWGIVAAMLAIGLGMGLYFRRKQWW